MTDQELEELLAPVNEMLVLQDQLIDGGMDPDEVDQFMFELRLLGWEQANEEMRAQGMTEDQITAAWLDFAAALPQDDPESQDDDL